MAAVAAERQVFRGRSRIGGWLMFDGNRLTCCIPDISGCIVGGIEPVRHCLIGNGDIADSTGIRCAVPLM